MKFKILLPVLLVSMAVGFILIYRDMGYAEDMDTGATEAAAEVYVATGSDLGVPEDICYSEQVKSVVFSHQKHAVELGFECTACHTNIFEMDANNVETHADFDMSGLGDGKYCGTCHSSSSNVAFSTDSQCARCHRGVKGLERMESTGDDREI